MGITLDPTNRYTRNVLEVTSPIFILYYWETDHNTLVCRDLSSTHLSER